jgi:hypothetical protein
MDQLRHPDLVAVTRRMRSRMDATLQAEQDAARVAYLRRRTLRDILLQAEDRGERVLVATDGGVEHHGHVTAVGVDQVGLESEGRLRYLSLHQIVWMEVEPNEPAT